ncbi:DegV family protein [Candidatus Clostridium stratigraminis]|uniref:DegV family protein n=1 Tax=Candidatus Clostridium stratigraminis TaxID=3381661 RepID=A0ABW8T7Y0_9CLOT
METVIIIDSCCDLPKEYIDKNNVPVLSMAVNFRGQEYKDDFGVSLPYKDFYDEVRKGEMPSTAQINVYDYSEEFKKHVSLGKSVICIVFSSALSGSYNSACIAMDMILEEYKDADITVIDSKCASLGEGLLDYYAIEMLKNGSSKDEIITFIENNKLKINHWFTVDDLNHLKRGGRVSATAAAIGTLLNIKPILHVDDEGRLIPVTKEKGRKKSIKALAEELDKNIVNPEEQIIFISHGDCIEDVELLKKLILERHKVKDIIVNSIGPVIGSHSGPGTVALFFMGEKR